VSHPSTHLGGRARPVRHFYGTDKWDPVAFRRVIDQYDDLGVTMTLVYFPAASRAEYCSLLAGFGKEFIRTQ
jgi:hypothetical protein